MSHLICKVVTLRSEDRVAQVKIYFKWEECQIHMNKFMDSHTSFKIPLEVYSFPGCTQFRIRVHSLQYYKKYIWKKLENEG